MEMDDLVLREKISKYEQVRRRLTRFKNQYNISDREIIEYLAEEIEQYRSRIKEQNKIIDEIHNKTIQSEVVELDCINDELVDEDITEIISTTQYATGKPILTKMEYKYKEG